MGRPLFYEILDKPATSCVIAICSLVWFYIQKNGIGYDHVGLSYQTAVEGHYWRIVTSAFSHISVLHLVFNMSALWSLGVVERLVHLGLGVEFYLEYTLVLVVLSGIIVLGMYHVLIDRFKVEYFRRVTSVGYSCVVFCHQAYAKDGMQIMDSVATQDRRSSGLMCTSRRSSLKSEDIMRPDGSKAAICSGWP